MDRIAKLLNIRKRPRAGGGMVGRSASVAGGGMAGKTARGGMGGFTLVEVIVALVIAMVVIGISGSLIVSGTQIFSKSAQRDMQMTLAESVLDLAADRLLYARSIEEVLSHVGDTAPDAGAVLRIAKPDGSSGAGKGHLLFRREGDHGAMVDVFGQNFYHNYNISMDIGITDQDGGAASFTMKVTVYDTEGRAVLERAKTRPLLNYEGPPESFGNMDSGNYIVINY